MAATLRVLGQDWKVRVVPANDIALDHGDCAGKTVFSKQTIYLSDRLVSSERQQVLLHELTHIVFEYILGTGISEEMVHSFSNVMFAILADNNIWRPFKGTR